MTDLSERLHHLADSHADTPGTVTFADVSAARVRQRRTSALLTGSVLATAFVTAFVLLRPTPQSTITAEPSPSPTTAISPTAATSSTVGPTSGLSVAASDVPVPQRVLDTLAAITVPSLSQGPRGAVAWLRTDARSAGKFWPDAVRPGYAYTGDPRQKVFVVVVGVKNVTCNDMGRCVREDGFMVGIVRDIDDATVAPMGVLEVPRSFTENAGLHRFTVNGYPSGMSDAVAARLPKDPSGNSLAWAQWQQKVDGQFTLYMYGHYVCGSCKVPRGASAPEGDMLTISGGANGDSAFSVIHAPDDPTIAPGFTAVFLPPITSGASPVPTTTDSTSPTPTSSTPTRPTSADAKPLVVNNFALMTHCGPLSLVYDGQYYGRVGGQLHYNDPSWNFTYTYGTLTITGQTAVFTDTAGHHETFVAQPQPSDYCR